MLKHFVLFHKLFKNFIHFELISLNEFYRVTENALNLEKTLISKIKLTKDLINLEKFR